jgi:hypothetical protein
MILIEILRSTLRMQTIDFLQTVKWLSDQFSGETKGVLLSGANFRIGHDAETQRKLRTDLLKASHELAALREKLQNHQFAPLVLQAFGLVELLEEDFPLRVADTALALSESKPGDIETIEKVLVVVRHIWGKWEILTKCVKPIEQLTIPQDVINEQDFDDILTIELQYEHDVNPKADTVSDVLLSTMQLYAALATVYGVPDYSPLRVIYIDSGSSFRFDLKGLGEPIRRIKELLVEGWNLIRYRKVEDFRHNNKALLESLEGIKRVHSMHEQGIIGQEDASRLRRQILESALSLFEAGALPREVPKIEIVSNQSLLEEMQRKLLPPAPDVKESEAGKQKQKVIGSKMKRPRKPSTKSKKGA